MMPDATIVKITMKSIFAALVSNSQHSPSHNSRMQAKRMMLPVVIVFNSFQSFITCKDNDYFLNNHLLSFFSFRLKKQRTDAMVVTPVLVIVEDLSFSDLPCATQ